MAKHKYVVRSGFHINKHDAEVLTETFKRMSNGNRRSIEAEDLVTLSKPKTAATHHMFEWDDKKAAHSYRVEQARHYIQAFDIVFDDSSDPVRAFPNVNVNGKATYMPMQRVLSNKDLIDQVVADALAQAESWTKRHAALRSVAKLAPVFEAIERATGTAA